MPLLGDTQLREWILDAEKRHRDERAVECEANKERKWLAAERATSERAQAEVEERSLQLRIKLTEMDAARGDRPLVGESPETAQAVHSQTINPRKFLPRLRMPETIWTLTSKYLSASPPAKAGINRTGPLH